MAAAALRNDDLAEAEVECAPKVLELVLQAAWTRASGTTSRSRSTGAAAAPGSRGRDRLR